MVEAILQEEPVSTTKLALTHSSFTFWWERLSGTGKYHANTL